MQENRTTTLPNLFSMLEEGSRLSVNEEAISMILPKGRFSIRYGQLRANSRRLAKGLVSMGVKKGDHVGGFLRNGIPFTEFWFAVSLVGAVFVPFNIALKGSLLNYQIIDSRVSLLCLDTTLLPELSQEVKSEGHLKRVVTLQGEMDSRSKLLDTYSYEDVMDNSELEAGSKVLRSDPACMLYTSGTTGPPKGVLLSHNAYINRTCEVLELYHAAKGSVFLNALPMFHTSGQVMSTLPALMSGGRVEMQEWFHASRFWEVAAESKAQYSFLLMTMVNILLKREDEYRENELKIILCGGASSKMWSEFEQKFRVSLLEGYGMTETCGVAIFNRLERLKKGSIGLPLSTIEISILDETGREIDKAHEPGELCLRPTRADTMMSGYYRRGEETNNAWVNGWFHTGDVAYRDGEGFYYFVERKKDIIRRRGENISPTDIENIVSRHDSVLECAAGGVKSSLGEERIVLYLVLNKELEDISAFLKWLDGELAYFMFPDELRIVESLPKTANQKVKRSELREGKIEVVKIIDLNAFGFKPSRPL